MIKKFMGLVTAALLALSAPAYSQTASTTTAPTYRNANNQPQGAQGVVLINPDGTYATPGQAFTGSSVVAPVVSTTAYTSNDAMGTLMTFSNALRSGKTTGMIQGVNLKFKSSQSSPSELWLFNANPSGTTVTDNGAFSVAVSDFNKVIGVIPISYCSSAGSVSFCSATGLATSFSVASGQSVYGVLVTRGTPTLSSTSDLSVELVLVQD